MRADSHTGRRLLAALRTLPRDELLEAPTADLLRLAQLVVDRAEHGTRRRVRAHPPQPRLRQRAGLLPGRPVRPGDPAPGRATSSAGYWPGEIIGRDDRIVELGPGPDAVPDRGAPGRRSRRRRTAPTVEAEVAKVTRRWSDDLRDLLHRRASARTRPSGCCARYAGALPEAYKEDFGAPTAVARPRRARARCRPTTGWPSTSTRPTPTTTADRRLKVFRTGTPVSLARALPIFTQMGIEVLDERPYEIELADGTTVWIYDFGLRLPAGRRLRRRSARATSSTRCGCCGAARSSRTASTRWSCAPA